MVWRGGDLTGRGPFDATLAPMDDARVCSSEARCFRRVPERSRMQRSRAELRGGRRA